MRYRAWTILFLVILSSVAQADFPDNTIPTMAIRLRGPDVAFPDLTADLLYDLSWKHFDAVNFTGWVADTNMTDYMRFVCDDAFMYYAILPAEIMQYLKEWGGEEFRYWFRDDSEELTSDDAFARCDADFDSILSTTSAADMFSNEEYGVRTTTEGLASTLDDYELEFLWFYEVYDEAPSQQWRHFVLDTIPLNDYMPNMYTQDVYTSGQYAGYPSMETIESSGIFSWQKYVAETYPQLSMPFTLDYGLLHHIPAGAFTGFGGQFHGTFHEQANSVRALLQAEYQPPSGDPVDQETDFIMFNYYPFRMVDSDLCEDYTICDDDWLYLVDHMEEGMDSTMLPAREEGCPVYFYPQTIGYAGGPAMYGNGQSQDLDYPSYIYRNPTPSEFRMLCNLALLHQAKGIFPYNLCSYVTYPYDLADSGNWISSSLLDRHNIPFDAPYEDWVYTGRWPTGGDYSYEYVPPDRIAPWADGFDPTCDLPLPPALGGQKRLQAYYQWLFAPYGELYESVEGTLADLKRIAPEMHDLWWWGEKEDLYWDLAEITEVGSYAHWVDAEVKVFRREGSDYPHLFYVNRYLRSEDPIAFDIELDDDDFPGILSVYAIDHSRRCRIPVNMVGTVAGIDDELKAGESRLVEFMSLADMQQPDLRLTDPDVFCYREGSIVRTSTLRCTAGEDLLLGATFYNMGTASTGDFVVDFHDWSTGSATLLGSVDGLRLPGLSAPYEPDSVSAVLLWETDSDDIGAHLVRIEASDIQGEETHDNGVWATVVIDPRDYATGELDDPWDMTESKRPNAPDWHTEDIDAVAGLWDGSAWTDSVSGMFEGVILHDAENHRIRGDISLSIPEDGEPVDTYTYHMMSLAMVGNNENRLPSEAACAIFVQWVDEEGEYHPSENEWCNLLSGTGRKVGNGWDMWSVLGPIDLSEIDGLDWASTDGEPVPPAEEVWLRFQTVFSEPFPITVHPIDIRIGWITLEES